MKRTWSEIINKNYDAILAEAQKAFCEAVDCQNMKYTVELREDGEVFSWGQAAGSHNFTQSSYEGRSTVICSFCFEHADIEIGDDVLRDHMTAEQIAEAEERAEFIEDVKLTLVLTGLLVGGSLAFLLGII